MDREEWDIEEVKRLKKKQMILMNIFTMLPLFLLIICFDYIGNPNLIVGIIVVLLWICAGYVLYTFITKKTIGTKASKKLQEFERHRIGEKRWKRREVTEVFVTFMITILLTVVFFVEDLNYNSPNYSFIVSFTVVWIVNNIKLIIGIRHLE